MGEIYSIERFSCCVTCRWFELVWVGFFFFFFFLCLSVFELSSNPRLQQRFSIGLIMVIMVVIIIMYTTVKLITIFRASERVKLIN